MKRAMITGATGAVGTALIEELIKNKVEILVLCREGSKRNSQIPVHPLVTMKYCSLHQLSDLQNDTGKEYDVFYHFAWDGTVGPARDDLFLQNLNARYALDAVEAAKRFGCRKFVGAGSQAEYGRVEGKLKPDTPVFPETGYGIGKLCAGQMTRIRARQLGMQHNWVRILSVYGPNDGSQSLVMTAINQLLANKIPKFTKGGQMWDYLYSSDAARAFYLIGENGFDGKIYVLGSGRARPLAEYIEEIRKAVNPLGKIDLGGIPYSEKQVMYLCADVDELEKDTGWKAEVDFAEGIMITAGLEKEYDISK